MATLEFGTHLRQLRVKAGKPLRDVARQVGFSPAYLSDIELNRRRPPSVEKIGKLALILNADIKELLGLARLGKQKVEIRLDHDKPLQMNAAMALARRLPEMDDKELEELHEWLEKRRYLERRTWRHG